MPIEWPIHLWHPPNTDADTDEYRRARDKAVEDIFSLRQGRRIVAVSGSGKTHECSIQAKHLGKTLAKLDFVMTSGGLDGVMFDVTDGFIYSGGFFSKFFGTNKKVAGRAVRIIPKGKETKAKELGKLLPGATLIYTDLPGTDSHDTHRGPSSRNHVLVATANAVICMPGGKGSIAEADLAANVYKKPVIAYVPVKRQTEWHTAVNAFGIQVVTEQRDLESWLRSKPF